MKARFFCASGHNTGFPDAFFDAIVNHGVIDSMRFNLAKKTMMEAERILAAHGYFYLDLISGNESNRAREFAEDVIVQSLYEEGTVQSYFNFAKIEKL